MALLHYCLIPPKLYLKLHTLFLSSGLDQVLHGVAVQGGVSLGEGPTVALAPGRPGEDGEDQVNEVSVFRPDIAGR